MGKKWGWGGGPWIWGAWVVDCLLNKQTIDLILQFPSLLNKMEWLYFNRRISFLHSILGIQLSTNIQLIIKAFCLKF
jgi:hypothetical protein